ncbi:hypothetical protein BTR22_07250 [Alkalihalophilus pseudofirmus]|uniref:McrB family protein n=1 Tax=Alkalihalophilus pseudofirmus TaxID=79885 RepID=UPI000952398B|nr:hypothetical protein BTR22_07250 [Alkalihalophilus pseudofirmus]
MNYPSNISNLKKVELKLGIKSSLSNLKPIISLVYSIWRTNNRETEILYSEEIEKSIVVKENIKREIKSYFDKQLRESVMSDTDFYHSLDNNELLKSQMEAIKVALELIWKLAIVKFEDNKKSFSAERQGGNRYAKVISYSKNIDTIDLLISNNEDDYKNILFNWITNQTLTINSQLEEALIKQLTVLAEETVYKLKVDDENNILFFISGAYKKIIEGEQLVNITDSKENKGPLRILHNILKENLNYYLIKNRTGTFLRDHSLLLDLTEYTKRVNNYLSLTNISIDQILSNGEVYESATPYEAEDNVSDITREQHIPLSIPEVVDHIHSYITAKGFYYEKDEVTNLYLSLKTKPFVILSGISGTGKTMIVRWFAESVGATEENGRFALIPVRPDWSDGSDLLGYVDIKGDFKEGPLTNVLKRAMQDPTNPYFVLLDEMNLARVEHYFSDLLSVMESRQWKDGEQVTSNVLPREITGEDLYLPSNMYLIGTVNMDETTHPFSKKVLDRANTIEFNRVQLDHLGFLKDQSEKSAMLMHNDRFVSQYLQLKDLYKDKPELIEEVTSILVKVNNILQFNGSHVGYRVRDEICFYIAYSQMHELFSFDEAIDHCLLQKILPRLAGSDSRVERVLKNLYTLFTNKKINDMEEVAPTDITDAPYPKSTEKVVEMLRRLEDDGFTSFWLNS